MSKEDGNKTKDEMEEMKDIINEIMNPENLQKELDKNKKIIDGFKNTIADSIVNIIKYAKRHKVPLNLVILELMVATKDLYSAMLEHDIGVRITELPKEVRGDVKKHFSKIKKYIEKKERKETNNEEDLRYIG